MTKPPKRCSSALRAVLSDEEVAPLLGVRLKTLRTRCRAGDEPGAVPSFDKNFVFDYRTVERLILGRLPEAFQETALRRVLGLRAGAVRVRAGEFADVHAERAAGTDVFLDDELLDLVREAATELGDMVANTASFDGWIATRGVTVNYRELMIRLSCADWSAVIDFATSAEDPLPNRTADLTDPLTALRIAGEDLALGEGLTERAFNEWAPGAGCPLRSHNVKRRFRGTWAAAKQAAGVHLDQTASRSSNG